MKRKMIGVAVAAVVLMAFFAACDNGAQDVKTIGYLVADAPTGVKAAQTTDKNYVIITWDAVQNGTGYTVYWQLDGKKTITQLFSGGSYSGNSNSFTYAVADGKESPNSDVDKWSGLLEIDPTYKIGDTEFKSPYLGKIRFGVRANVLVPGSGSTGNTSDVVWSDYITVAAPAAP